MQFSIFTDHAMAGNHQCDWVCSTCSSYCTRGLRSSESISNPSVGGSLTVRNGLDLLPDLPLERCTRHVERKFERRLPSKISDECVRPVLHSVIVALKTCRGIIFGKHSLDCTVRISHTDGADSSLGGSHKQTSDWRVNDRVLNPQPSPTLANRSRICAEPAGNFLLHSTSRKKSSILKEVVYFL